MWQIEPSGLSSLLPLWRSGFSPNRDLEVVENYFGLLGVLFVEDGYFGCYPQVQQQLVLGEGVVCPFSL